MNVMSHVVSEILKGHRDVRFNVHIIHDGLEVARSKRPEPVSSVRSGMITAVWNLSGLDVLIGPEIFLWYIRAEKEPGFVLQFHCFI